MANKLEVKLGKVNGIDVNVMRDTGCTTVFVKSSLVRSSQWTGEQKKFYMINKSFDYAPVAEIELDCPWFKGTVRALCPDSLVCDVIVGQIPGCDLANAVVTRSMKENSDKPPKPLKVVKGLSQLNVSPSDFSKEQSNDDSLASAWKLAKEKKVSQLGRGTCTYEISGGLLYRTYVSEVIENGKLFKQLMVPKAFRLSILSLAHDSTFAGHMGADNTRKKIMETFFWPGIMGDVVRYCRSCVECQRTVPRGLIRKAPLERFPLIDIPFHRVAVDIIGPILPSSEKGNRYILTCVDFATRYPEAVPLKNIDNVSVAEALVGIFSRVGVPKEVLSDNGSSFKSEMMSEVSRLLSLRQLFCTPYHSMGNSVCERFNGTLRRMLRKNVS